MSRAKLVKQKGLIAAMRSLTDAVQREPGKVVKTVVAPDSATNTVYLAVTAADGHESVDRFEVAQGLRRMCIYCAGFEATATCDIPAADITRALPGARNPRAGHCLRGSTDRPRARSAPAGHP
jgi:hypothetical protein